MAKRQSFHQGPAAEVRILEAGERERVPETGAIDSVQEAEAVLRDDDLDRIWHPEYLERLARSYWAFLSKFTLHIVKVRYEPEARVVVALRFIPLLRFHTPEYDLEPECGSVTWRIERGVLVAKQGRGRGFLRIRARRLGDAPPPAAADGGDWDRVHLAVEVRNFYPWLRGGGRFARFGAWLYGQTQVRIHRLVTFGFLRSLANLDLPPSRIGALRAEIADGDEG